MNRITREALVNAVVKVRAMDAIQKERLADEVYLAQPNLLASFLVQRNFGVSLMKMEFLLEVLLICFQAMKESGHAWPLITEDDQDRQLAHLVAMIQSSEIQSYDDRDRTMRHYIETHPEKELLAFIQMETSIWLNRVEPEESDKWVVLAARNMVDCIAFVPSREQRTPRRREHRLNQARAVAPAARKVKARR